MSEFKDFKDLIGAEAVFTMETPIGPVYVYLMSDGAVRWEAAPTTRLPRDEEAKPPTERKRTKEELLKVLDGEIFAAQMKVILDKELGRATSETVKKLAAMKLPKKTRREGGAA